jgi:hypothetical protein
VTIDCGTASLAILTGLAYPDVAAAARELDPKGEGLYNRELVAIARRLGVTLTQTRRFDPAAEGVLRIRWNGGDRRRRFPDGHFVVLRKGTVICNEFGLRTWDHYQRQYDCRPCTLLKIAH